ncbi:hypothetical protein ScPMuIL_002873 [Solemya velum]
MKLRIRGNTLNVEVYVIPNNCYQSKEILWGRGIYSPKKVDCSRMSTNKIIIFIQAFNTHKTLQLEMKRTDIMQDLYKKISNERKVEIQFLKLVFAGKIYRPEDDSTSTKTLADIGIGNRFTIQVVPRQPGRRYQGYVGK